jgi:EAL domain-containing protein (putative c-di-GMP-specific phosphodiesterase class I)
MDAPDVSKFETLFEHQPIDKSRLILTVPAFVAVNANPDVEKSLKDCAELGVMLMVDSWDPDTLPLERVKELGFQYVRLHPDQYLKKEIADLLSSLPANGITAYAKDADTEDALRWLVACGVKHFVSVTTGYPVDEDSLIRDSLLRERDDG